MFIHVYFLLELVVKQNRLLWCRCACYCYKYSDLHIIRHQHSPLLRISLYPFP